METSLIAAKDASGQGWSAPALKEKKLSDAVRERRATPAFSSDPVDDGDLKKILRAGLEAPSSYNLQPWRFVVVRDLEQRKRLCVAAMNQEQVEQAPVVIVACGDTEGGKEDLDESSTSGRVMDSTVSRRSNASAGMLLQISERTRTCRCGSRNRQ